MPSLSEALIFWVTEKPAAAEGGSTWIVAESRFEAGSIRAVVAPGAAPHPPAASGMPNDAPPNVTPRVSAATAATIHF